MTDQDDDGALLSRLARGGKAALARVLARLEAAPHAAETIALLDAAWVAPKGHVLGLTGPPGVGKSSLIDALVRAWRGADESVAVLAVDPSSRASRGALLGDRTRLNTDPGDDGVFVRSMAARDRLGGLAALSFPAMVLMRALYDHVIMETVGVGQSETDIAGMADTVVLCVQPGSGDSLQYMKAGIIEVPDIVVVTKADMGALATRALGDIKGALSLSLGTAEDDGWAVRALALSTHSGAGLAALMDAVAAHWRWLCQGDRLAQRRQSQGRAWVKAEIVSEIGRRGYEKLGAALKTGTSPF
ncbi:MAG: methylmalonyl Co-A mutase-associated GTPase MeaB, partial [Alphaproteobacteria bacterium]